MVKINIEIDKATHKAVKIKAIEEGKAMKEYIVDVLKEAAGTEKEKGKGKRG